jgi:hypothetical protein
MGILCDAKTRGPHARMQNEEAASVKFAAPLQKSL